MVDRKPHSKSYYSSPQLSTATLTNGTTAPSSSTLVLDHAERASSHGSLLSSHVSSWLSSVTESPTPSPILPWATPPSSPQVGKLFTAELTAEDLSIDGLNLDDVFEDADLVALHAPPCSAPQKRSRRDKVAYVVFHGRKTGVFETWAAAEMQVWHFPGQRHKGYRTVQEAFDAWEHARANGTVGPVRTEEPVLPRLTEVKPRPPPISCTPPPSHRRASSRPPPLPRPQAATRMPPTPSSPPSSPQPPSSPPQRAPSPPCPPTASSRDQREVHPPSLPPPPRPPRPHARHSLAQYLEPKPLSDAETYFVVYAGVRPGVYLGRKAAVGGLGRAQMRALYKTGSEEQGNRLFVYLSMHELIVKGAPMR
ncbi:hypothetical protein FPV67DRAFT_1681829 [Lyophyllum atratum]|nr:hypothetical protein FPV67DRAFT_1681829 [Lyophyllum atratum]